MLAAVTTVCNSNCKRWLSFQTVDIDPKAFDWGEAMRVELTWMRNMDYPLYTDEVELVHEKRITPFGNVLKSLPQRNIEAGEAKLLTDTWRAKAGGGHAGWV